MKPNWNKNASFNKSFETISNMKLCKSFSELTNLSPIENFHKFLLIEYLAHLSGMVKLYVVQKRKILMQTKKILGSFLDCSYLVVYLTVPGEDLYMCTYEDLSIPIVASVMSRARFRKIKKYSHIIVSSKLKPVDKLGKISPLFMRHK